MENHWIFAKTFETKMIQANQLKIEFEIWADLTLATGIRTSRSIKRFEEV